MGLKIFLLFTVFLARFYSQDSLPNLCAKNTLGNNAPSKKEECFQDLTFANVDCCFIEVTNVETPFKFCAPLDVGEKESTLKNAVIKVFPPAEVAIECSASIISVRIFMTAIFLILLF